MIANNKDQNCRLQQQQAIFVWRSATENQVVPKIWFPNVCLLYLIKHPACPGIPVSWKYQPKDL